jgi:hypothetical protein
MYKVASQNLICNHFFLKKELIVIVNIAHQLYYAKVLNLALRDPKMLSSLSNKAMESVWKNR